MERIIEKGLRCERETGEQQFGFMPARGTTDAIFALSHMMEKYVGKQKKLHLIFIDIEQAHDRVSREETWRCMREN